MKSMKKVFALLLAVVMVMGLSVTAFAAEITVNGVAGESYTAYKIFDVTASTSYVVDATNGTYYHNLAEGADPEYTTEAPDDTSNYEKDSDDAYVMYAAKENYSYTIASDSAWLSVIAKDEDSDGVYTSTFTGLTLTLPAGSTKYNVSVGEGFSAPDFAALLIQNVSGKTVAAGPTVAGEDGAVTFTGLGAGYYLVDSTLGALCILNTSSDTVTIYEKNSDPTIKKYVLEDDDNSTHVKNTTDDWNEDDDYAVLDVIDNVYYKLVVNTGTNEHNTDTEIETETGVDKNYTIVDTLPDGITYNTDSIVVKAGDDTWTKDTDYTVSYDTDKNELTIVLDANGKLADLVENSSITITYNAKMTAGSNGVAIGTSNKNTVTLKYSEQTVTDYANVRTYQLVNDADGDDSPDFKKVDGTTQQALEGVTFVLSRVVNGTTQYATFTDGYLTGWDATTQEAASKLVTDVDGTFNLKGLDAGEYILTETATLNGYNLLDYTITVTIKEDGSVEYIKTGETKTANGNYSTITVENNTGTELPSTGGIGTTIFYVVGSILVIGAAVLLITKKRMNGTAE